MKTVAILLGVSLLVNATLAVRAWQTNSARGAAAPEAAAMTAAEASAAGAAKNALAAKPAGPSKGRDLWERMRADDLRGLVAQLRAAGCPPHLLRAIVQAELRHQTAPQRAALVAELPTPDYWKPGRYGNNDPRLGIAWRRHHREQQERLRELLGESNAMDPFQLEMSRRRYGPLSPEAIERLETITADYDDLRGEVFATSNSVLLPEDREKLAFLEREQRADLMVAMSSEELLQYELRQSRTAQRLRHELAPFSPSEDEYRRAFFALRAAEDAQPTAGYSTVFNLSETERTTLRAQLQGQLTAERFAEFEHATDPTLTGLNRLMLRLGLPATASRDVTAVATDINTRAAAIRNNRELTEAQRQAELRALGDEATRRLSGTLGESGLAAYRQFGGQWLNFLTPPPPSPGGP